MHVVPALKMVQERDWLENMEQSDLVITCYQQIQSSSAAWLMRSVLRHCYHCRQGRSYVGVRPSSPSIRVFFFFCTYMILNIIYNYLCIGTFIPNNVGSIW